MNNNTNAITTTKEKLTAAFEKWEREYRETPEKFEERAATLQRETEAHGELLALTLIEYLKE